MYGEVRCGLGSLRMTGMARLASNFKLYVGSANLWARETRVLKRLMIVTMNVHSRRGYVKLRQMKHLLHRVAELRAARGREVATLLLGDCDCRTYPRAPRSHRNESHISSPRSIAPLLMSVSALLFVDAYGGRWHTWTCSLPCGR